MKIRGFLPKKGWGGKSAQTCGESSANKSIRQEVSPVLQWSGTGETQSIKVREKSIGLPRRFWDKPYLVGQGEPRMNLGSIGGKVLRSGRRDEGGNKLWPSNHIPKNQQTGDIGKSKERNMSKEKETTNNIFNSSLGGVMTNAMRNTPITSAGGRKTGKETCSAAV